MKPEDLSICAIVRDEATNLEEWLAFHRLVGVSKFVLYDDRSVDGTAEIAERHRDVILYRHSRDWDADYYDGIDGVSNWPKTPQAHAFQHYCCHHHLLARWCAFIDVDEFLFHTWADSIPEFLERRDDNGGVVANWVVFGSNGHQTRPHGLTIENYTRRALPGQPEPWGRHVKTIVNMRYGILWGPHGSHTPVIANSVQVTQHGKPNPWSMTPEADIDGLRVNHYYHRSAEEAAAKAVKHDNNAPPGYPNVDRVAAHDRNEVEDRAILRFLPALKEALA